MCIQASDFLSETLYLNRTAFLMYPMLHNAVTISLLAMFIDEKSSLVRPPAANTQAELVKLVDHLQVKFNSVRIFASS